MTLSSVLNTLRLFFSVLLLVGFTNVNAEFSDSDSDILLQIQSDTSQLNYQISELSGEIYGEFYQDMSDINNRLLTLLSLINKFNTDLNAFGTPITSIDSTTQSINDKLSDIYNQLSGLNQYIIDSSGYFESINNAVISIDGSLSSSSNADILAELQQFHADMNYVLEVEYGTISELFGELMYGYGTDSTRAGSILGLDKSIKEFHTDFLDMFQIWYDYATRSNEIYNLPDVLNEISTIPLLNALSNITSHADMGIVTNIYEVTTNLQFLATAQTNLTFDILQAITTNVTDLTNPISESEVDSRSSFSLETATSDFNRSISTNDANIVFKEAPDFGMYTNVTYLSEAIKESPHYQEVSSNSSNLITKVESFYNESVHFLDEHVKKNDLITRQWSTTVTLVPKNAISTIPDGISWDMSKLKLNPYITTYLGRLWDFLGMILDFMACFYVGTFVLNKAFPD